jgi:hypothetical protein
MSSVSEGALIAIVALWRDHGVSIRRPATLGEIASAEPRLGVPFRPEVSPCTVHVPQHMRPAIINAVQAATGRKVVAQ